MPRNSRLPNNFALAPIRPSTKATSNDNSASLMVSQVPCRICAPYPCKNMLWLHVVQVDFTRLEVLSGKFGNGAVLLQLAQRRIDGLFEFAVRLAHAYGDFTGQCLVICN